MKRLLAISWALPPILKPRSLQVARVLKALAPLGWEIDVVSVDPRSSITARPLDKQVEAHYNGAYQVHRVPGLPGQLLATAASKFIPALGPVPDVEGFWRGSAIAKAKSLLTQGQYAALLSFAQPWSSHLVALKIHRDYGLPWAAHFSDPWVDNDYYTSLTNNQRARMRAWEGEVVAAASRLIFTNRQTAHKVMAKYPPEWGGKTSVVPHAFDESLLPPAADTAAPSRPCLQLVYTGSLYGLRSPEALIRALARSNAREKIRVQLAGSIKNVKKYIALAEELGVAGLVDFVGQLDYQGSLRLLSGADALLLIDAPSAAESLFLPSKLIDYLMFNKLILGLTPLQGASAEVLQKIDCPVVAPEDVAGIAAQLDALADRWAKRRLALPASANKIRQEYSSETIARRFGEILEGLPNFGV